VIIKKLVESKDEEDATTATTAATTEVTTSPATAIATAATLEPAGMSELTTMVEKNLIISQENPQAKSSLQ